MESTVSTTPLNNRLPRRMLFALLALLLSVTLVTAGCSLESDDGGSGSTGEGELARVVRVADGDTITVEINGQEFRVRYIGINTPERANFGDPAEPCAAEATAANRALVEGETVRLVRDVSDVDRFDRLLRYVYVGDTFVNEVLVRDGYAEAVRYAPDVEYFERFRELEQQAAAARRGCHPTGIFDDGTEVR